MKSLQKLHLEESVVYWRDYAFRTRCVFQRKKGPHFLYVDFMTRGTLDFGLKKGLCKKHPTFANVSVRVVFVAAELVRVARNAESGVLHDWLFVCFHT